MVRHHIHDSAVIQGHKVCCKGYSVSNPRRRAFRRSLLIWLSVSTQTSFPPSRASSIAARRAAPTVFFKGNRSLARWMSRQSNSASTVLLGAPFGRRFGRHTYCPTPRGPGPENDVPFKAYSLLSKRNLSAGESGPLAILARISDNSRSASPIFPFNLLRGCASHKREASSE